VGGRAWLHRFLSVCADQFRDAEELLRPGEQPLLRHPVAVHRHRYPIRTHRRHLRRKIHVDRVSYRVAQAISRRLELFGVISVPIKQYSVVVPDY